MTSDPDWAHNPDARDWVSANPPGAGAIAFHRSLPGYRPTPLVELADVAGSLGVATVLVKDESDRFGLPAFKVLGAAWAINRALSLRAGRATPAPDLDALAAIGVRHPVTLVAATDGNHGHAVAHLARLLGLGACIYLPDGVAGEVVDAIEAEGAEVICTDLVYDRTVQTAANSVGTSDLLIQDTSWKGYEDVPSWIVDGYSTIFTEIDEQVSGRVDDSDLVSVPTGVGSLLQSALAHYRTWEKGRGPAVLAVEPVVAACVTQSLLAGSPTTVDTSRPTTMAGLRCGTVSDIAWPAVRDGLDAAITVTDDETARSQEILTAHGVSAGPCGAAALAGVIAALGDEDRRHQLGVTPESAVLLISTESRR